MFEVDDRVWSSIMGWGVVKKISCTNRVTVCFDKGVNLIFTEDGRLYDKGLRCLFFKEVVPQKEICEKPRWRAKYGENYFFINTYGRVDMALETNEEFDRLLFGVKNYFRTEEEAVGSKIYKVFHEL